ncbi:unnamed protein product [Chrysoparadoxa australica]
MQPAPVAEKATPAPRQPPSPQPEAVSNAAAEQMAALVSLMQQQLSWIMQRQERPTEPTSTIADADALEARMRNMESSIPAQMEGYIAEGMEKMQASVSNAIAELRELQQATNRGSNAGALLDDYDNETSKPRETQTPPSVRSPPASITSASLSPLRAAEFQSASTPTRLQATPNRAEEAGSTWELPLPNIGGRAGEKATVTVHDLMTTGDVIGLIAEELDVDEQRVVLRRKSSSRAVGEDKMSAYLKVLYRGGDLEVQVVKGSTVTDEQVDALADYYDMNLPKTAKSSLAVQSRLGKLEASAKGSTLYRSSLSLSRSSGFDRELDDDDLDDQKVQDLRGQLQTTLGSTQELGSTLRSEISVEGSSEGALDTTASSRVEELISSRQLSRSPVIQRRMHTVAMEVESELKRRLGDM